jgi:hypothetical protein
MAMTPQPRPSANPEEAHTDLFRSWHAAKLVIKFSEFQFSIVSNAFGVLWFPFGRRKMEFAAALEER